MCSLCIIFAVNVSLFRKKFLLYFNNRLGLMAKNKTCNLDLKGYSKTHAIRACHIIQAQEQNFQFFKESKKKKNKRKEMRERGERERQRGGKREGDREGRREKRGERSEEREKSGKVEKRERRDT